MDPPEAVTAPEKVLVAVPRVTAPAVWLYVLLKVVEEELPVKVPPEMVAAPEKVLVPEVELKVPVPESAKVELALKIEVDVARVPEEMARAPVMVVVPPPVL